MGIRRHITIGWICILREDLHAYTICEELGREDFIVGTDGICGEQNHICVFNATKDTHFRLDAEDHVLVKFSDPHPPLTEEAEQFILLVKERYGDDAVEVVYGALNWYS